MNRSTLLVILGGILGAIAFFLPLLSYQGFSASLFDEVKNGNQLTGTSAYLWIEPIASAVLILFGLLYAFQRRASEQAMGFLAGLFGLGIMIYFYFQVQSDLSKAGIHVSTTTFLGIGFWIACVGFILGLAGSAIGNRF